VIQKSTILSIVDLERRFLVWRVQARAEQHVVLVHQRQSRADRRESHHRGEQRQEQAGRHLRPDGLRLQRHAHQPEVRRQVQPRLRIRHQTRRRPCRIFSFY